MKTTIVKSENLPHIRILKIRSCSSRTGKSTLTYHIGCNAEGELQFRIFANSGNGFFNDEWVSLNALLSKASEQFTSYALSPLFRGKSTNTPAFLLAALMAEKLVQVSGKNKRCYEKGDSSQFLAEMKVLIDAKTDLKEDAKVTQKGKTA
jgi:hypothetical protein